MKEFITPMQDSTLQATSVFLSSLCVVWRLEPREELVERASESSIIASELPLAVVSRVILHKYIIRICLERSNTMVFEN
jgi:hypothetical protein